MAVRDARIADWLEQITDAQRREDAKALLAFFEQATGYPARLWRGDMAGFGRYAYTYDSGHSGEFLMAGFALRKANISIHILPGYDDFSDLRAVLGKHKAGKSCLYIRRVSDIDLAVLAQMVARGFESLRARYETFPE